MSIELDRYKTKLEKAEQKIFILEQMIEYHSRELYFQNQQLERKNKELEQFSYISSHDLQEPLRTVTSLVEILKVKYQDQLDDTAEKSFNFLAAATNRMRDLIKGLLDYSRLGKQRVPIEIDCNELVKAVIIDLSDAIEQSGATLIVGILPILKAYDTELRLMFQNLISNAIKFHRKNIPPYIEISASKEEGYQKFLVKDNGIGIESRHGEKVFTIFQRLHSCSEYDGIGIGLAHCKKIADLHEGDIRFESVPNMGTTFHFTVKID